MVSELYFTVANRLGKSFLQQAYCTHPFKLAPIGENPEDPTLYLMIRSSSPGVLDNDNFKINININENCRLNLQTQSYQRIFTMENGARQEMLVNLAVGSYLNFISHPLVPHQDSKFQSRSIIKMAKGSELIWGEIITCGRKLSGEEFKFTYLRNTLEIYREGQLIFKDQLLLCPENTPFRGIGLFENFTHQANLIYLPGSPVHHSLLNNIQEYFLKKSNLAAGFTMIACNGILIRILGNSGEQLFNCLQELSLLFEKILIDSGNLLTPQI